MELPAGNSSWGQQDEAFHICRGQGASRYQELHHRWVMLSQQRPTEPRSTGHSTQGEGDLVLALSPTVGPNFGRTFLQNAPMWNLFPVRTKHLGEYTFQSRLGMGAALEQLTLICLMTEPKVQVVFLEKKQTLHLLGICVEGTWTWYLEGGHLGTCHSQRQQNVAAPKASLLWITAKSHFDSGLNPKLDQ